ncbi:hypothetical protein B2H97_16030 [Paraclostridium bifermentans]|uniref:phage distal tail protein n=1 Tax=Paraclostridium bifermentans TaxID=1490 RepID=UPI000A16D0F6|nr:hypothetical protein [Paraclostridium bifermentans]OSB07976.1 hypothetical protein B2H97_16030 [Paraclostridium bifermentans]
MLIDNLNISSFNAKLLSRKIKTAKLENFNFWSKYSLLPYINDKFTESYKEIELEIDIICKDANELETMKSKLIYKIKKSILKFIDIDYKYFVFLEDTPDITYIMPGNEILKFKFLGYCFKDEIIENINRVTSKTIDSSGNSNTPIIMEITPVIDMIDLKITGLSEDPLIVKNLKGNKTIIIDGIEGTVTQDGINKFEDTDMWEFPFLVPGKNNITLSKDTCNITIKYNPRFI